MAKKSSKPNYEIVTVLANVPNIDNGLDLEFRLMSKIGTDEMFIDIRRVRRAIDKPDYYLHSAGIMLPVKQIDDLKEVILSVSEAVSLLAN